MEYYIISDIRNSDVDLEENDQKVSLSHISFGGQKSTKKSP